MSFQTTNIQKLFIYRGRHLLIEYLFSKFEQNRSINGRETETSIFKSLYTYIFNRVVTKMAETRFGDRLGPKLFFGSL